MNKGIALTICILALCVIIYIVNAEFISYVSYFQDVEVPAENEIHYYQGVCPAADNIAIFPCEQTQTCKPRVCEQKLTEDDKTIAKLYATLVLYATELSKATGIPVKEILSYKPQ